MTEVNTTKAKQYKIGQALEGDKVSKLAQYQRLVIGKKDLIALIKYELIMSLISWIPGALGLFLRSRLYPLILGQVGKHVIFGTNIVMRHPHKIRFCDNVIIDDNCLLDAKGSSNSGIIIGSNVYIGRNSILSCKDGDIVLKDHVNLGFNCEIFSSSKVYFPLFTLLNDPGGNVSASP